MTRPEYWVTMSNVIACAAAVATQTSSIMWGFAVLNALLVVIFASDNILSAIRETDQ